jgi:hypothetical protein
MVVCEIHLQVFFQSVSKHRRCDDDIVNQQEEANVHQYFRWTCHQISPAGARQFRHPFTFLHTNNTLESRIPIKWARPQVQETFAIKRQIPRNTDVFRCKIMKAVKTLIFCRQPMDAVTSEHWITIPEATSHLIGKLVACTGRSNRVVRCLFILIVC